MFVVHLFAQVKCDTIVNDEPLAVDPDPAHTPMYRFIPFIPGFK